jgi:arylformamidase
MNRRVILSYPIEEKTPLYGDTPQVSIRPLKSIGSQGGSRSYILSMCNHSGTHVDAPAHFIENGKQITDFSQEDLVFNKPFILNCPKEPNEWVGKEDVANIPPDSDFVLVLTGFWRFRSQPRYRTENPGMSPEAIEAIRRDTKVRCIAIDSISISGFQDRQKGRESHKAAFVENKVFGPPLLLIEDINAAPVQDPVRLVNVMVFPWQVKGIDSAPCTVLAEVVGP